MPITTTDIYKQMDEEYGNSMEKCFGPGLLTYPEDIDSSRMYMFSSNLKQILTLLEPDVPHIMTGYENTVGEHNHAYKLLKGNWIVKDIIPKYGPNSIYMMVLYNPDEDLYDMVEKKPAENLTEKFGYAYNTSFMDSLQVGDTLHDQVLYKSTSYDEHMNYCPGKNARVMYITDNSTIEDSIVISKSWADKVRTVEVDSIEVSINSNDILLNMYGDRSFYKTFPDIGEAVENSLLCAVRRVNLNHILYDFQEKNLRTPQSTDVERYASKNAIVYDIDIYYNGETDFPDNTFYRQLKKYYDMECVYADQVTTWAKRIKESGSNYTKAVAYHKAKWQRFNNKEYAWKNRDSAFSNIVVKFSTMAVITLQEGFKLTGRYGDKGIISSIRDCGDTTQTLFNQTMDSILDLAGSSNMSPEDREKLASHVSIVDDCEMPYLEDGTKVEILLNSSGAIRRLNSGQLFEVEINFVAENIQKKLRTMKDPDEKCELIFKFLDLLNKDQSAFYLSIYHQFDRWEEFDQYKIHLLDEEGRDAFFKDIEDNGFYIVKRPDAPIRYKVMSEIYDAFPWIKPYEAYIDRFGIKHRKIIHPIICGSKYMLVLKQTSNKNFSARSTGRIDKKGLPAKSSDKKQNLAPYSRTPIRIGESHNLNAAMTGSTLAEFNIFTKSSPVGRKELKRILEASGDPFKVEEFEIKDDYTNQNAVILNAYLKSMGIALEFDIDGYGEEIYADVPTEMEIDGYLVYDLLSKRDSYKKLFAKFREYMESHEVIEVASGQKEKMAWDWVFSQKDIDQVDLSQFDKEFLNTITTPIQKEDIMNSETEIDDTEEIEDEDSMEESEE